MSNLLRGGRIPHVKKDVVKFTSSIQNDRKLLSAVIRINQAHVIMLMEQNIILQHDGIKLLQALSKLKPNIKLDASLEDVHMFVEEKVTNLCGLQVGGNLHIGKSRNDQVATAIRMELRESLIAIMGRMLAFQEALIKLAENHVETVFPGYTHTQPAQPVTFAHYLLSHVDGIERGFQRLVEAYRRVNLCPMGAGALATSSFPLNRERVAELLGFEGIVENSLDAVSNRDFILETIGVLAITAVDISRFVEDFILWGSLDFGLIELPDEFSSTSSIMPQKKNFDVLEVIRARMSQVLGNFVAAASTLKALPSGYNLDFQEITPRLWESLEIVQEALEMLSALVAHLKLMEKAAYKPHFEFMAGTELANTLVRKYKVPFRSAHKIIGAVMRKLIKQGLTVKGLKADFLNRTAKSLGFSLNLKDEDIRKATDLAKIVESHNVKGGPSPVEVERMLKLRKEKVASAEEELARKISELKKSRDKMQSILNSYLSSSQKETQNLKS